MGKVTTCGVRYRHGGTRPDFVSRQSASSRMPSPCAVLRTFGGAARFTDDALPPGTEWKRTECAVRPSGQAAGRSARVRSPAGFSTTGPRCPDPPDFGRPRLPDLQASAGPAVSAPQSSAGSSFAKSRLRRRVRVAVRDSWATRSTAAGRPIGARVICQRTIEPSGVESSAGIALVFAGAHAVVGSGQRDDGPDESFPASRLSLATNAGPNAWRYPL